MKLAIGMPIQDDLPGEAFIHHIAVFTEAIKKWSTDAEPLVTIIPVGMGPHDRVRLFILEEAIKQGCNRLFMMDDDTLTPRGGLSELMWVMDERKVAAISGFYLRRGDPYTPVWCNEMDGKFYLVDADSGIHDIGVSGLGCCLIDLDWVSANVPKPWFQMNQKDGYTDITDDIVFFNAIRKAGGTLLGDANVQCTHIGPRMTITRQTAASLRLVNQVMTPFPNLLSKEVVK